MEFHLNGSEYILVEQEAYPGVARIAETIAGDIESVTGHRPGIRQSFTSAPAILCATWGRSPLAQKMAEQGILSKEIAGKREVYQIALTEIDDQPALVICGSDKRGTIYGMFALSEAIGVSPLCFFGDVAPLRRDRVSIGKEIETISKEPSVKYRGFFINDEWPCFGSWATRRYGDVNAQCYDVIFQFLLRMKGNYLWPAMWASSFPLDGPGSANEELADLYGVIMGYSHHEPCLRASEEWDKVKGDNTPYGTAWNFDTNEEGLTNYWRDALIRSGKYENIITIGMRGERDSSILGDESPLKANIDLLKNVITRQRALIDAYVPRKATQLLALYKEVEQYFYGDAKTPGLKDWAELDDVLFLLCEDNFGHLRTVPPKDMVNHPGGWGMYYHFDYHGGPISYEWVDSTPLAQTWEAMTQAWDWGIRELWVVNVGDLKLHEVPLTYFMQLAYDFDTWGTGHPDSPAKYVTQWTNQNFPQVGDAVREEIGSVLQDYLTLNSLRRPEAMNAEIYHPCHYDEYERMLKFVNSIEGRSRAVLNTLCPREATAYYSMIHFSAMASANLVKLHLYAGKNHHYARQGKVITNRYAQACQECMTRDMALTEEFAAFENGKWAGMELAPHMGFTKWNEDDSRYPVLCHVTPMPKACMKVSRSDRQEVATKNYGTPMVICVDFLSPGRMDAKIEIANGGSIPFHFTLSGSFPAWLTADMTEGTVEEQTVLTLHCNESLLPERKESCTLTISDGDATVAIAVTGLKEAISPLPPMTFLPQGGIIAIPAAKFAAKQDTPQGAFYEIQNYGKYGSGMKVAPSTAAFSGTDAPSLTYRFRVDTAGEYVISLLTAPNNPVQMGSAVHLGVLANQQFTQVELLSSAFRAGENSDTLWCAGVLNQIHVARHSCYLPAGVQEVNIFAQEPGVVLERIEITPANHSPLPGYLGAEDSPHSPAVR